MTALAERLRRLGMRVTAAGLDDLIALATTKRWSPMQLLEHIAEVEAQERGRRSLERRLSSSHLGRFKPLADFDWAWPKKIDRDAMEALVRLDFLTEARTLLGADAIV